MASLVTIADIKRRARQRADMERSGFVSDAEVLDMINESYAELFDLLVMAFGNYFITEYTLNLVVGTSSYAVPADFYKLVTLDMAVSSNQYTTVFPYNELERNATLSTTGDVPNATVRMRYISAPTRFTQDTDTIDCVAGWESLLITDVAIMMMDKEESDTDRLEKRRMREYQRIQQMAQNRDITMPGRITDVTVYDNAYLTNALRYRFYGNNIEFITVEYIGV